MMLGSFSPLMKRKKSLKVRSEKTPRREFRKHEQWLRSTFVCFLFGHPDHECEGKIEVMHDRDGTDGCMARKPSSWWTLPGCQGIHCWQHQNSEAAVERKFGVNLKRICLKYARLSPDSEMKLAMQDAERQHPEMFQL